MKEEWKQKGFIDEPGCRLHWRLTRLGEKGCRDRCKNHRDVRSAFHGGDMQDT